MKESRLCFWLWIWVTPTSPSACSTASDLLWSPALPPTTTRWRTPMPSTCAAFWRCTAWMCMQSTAPFCPLSCPRSITVCAVRCGASPASLPCRSRPASKAASTSASTIPHSSARICWSARSPHWINTRCPASSGISAQRPPFRCWTKTAPSAVARSSREFPPPWTR